MSISALNSAMPAMYTAHSPEAKEGPGPDHDGDADDKGVSSASITSAAALPPGVGKTVNTVA